MSIKNLISVIIPVYNTEKYLKECIMSLTSQSYSNLEIILVNDGSTDSCGILCDEMAKSDSRIRLIHKKNEGVSIARNTGIDAARGEYIGFIDSDDFCEPVMYQKLFDALTANNADISLCSFCTYDGRAKHKVEEPLRTGFYSKNQIKDEIILPMVGSPETAPRCAPVMGTLWRCLFKSELIKANPDLKLRTVKMAEDLLFDIEYLCRCKSAFVIDEALYNYRQFAQSSSHKYITDLYGNISKQMDLMKEVLINNSIFDKRMEEYLNMTVLYNLTWCISNECKNDNPLSLKEVVRKLSFYRNLREYKHNLRWKYIKNISVPERYYFSMIKLRLYPFVIWMNRR